MGKWNAKLKSEKYLIFLFTFSNKKQIFFIDIHILFQKRDKQIQGVK